MTTETCVNTQTCVKRKRAESALESAWSVLITISNYCDDTAAVISSNIKALSDFSDINNSWRVESSYQCYSTTGY